MDPWTLAGLPGRLGVAAYLTADHAAQYRVIVDALLDIQEHSLTGVGRDDLEAAVRERIAAMVGREVADRLTSPGLFDLDKRLEALEDDTWGVVISWQSRATTDAEYLRSRDRYQLTPKAADLHRWLRRSIDDDSQAVSAASFAPAVIEERLREMLQAAEQQDHEAAAKAWAQVQITLRHMADAAAIWQARMASALAGAPDERKMRALRTTLMAYVNVWGAGVDTYTPRIRETLTRLEGLPAEAWRRIALVTLDIDAPEEAVAEVLAGSHISVAALRRWFGGSTAQAQRLRRQVRDAVPPLLRGSRALFATSGRVTRRAELLRLAGAMETAATDMDAWRVWCKVTGLWAPRHMPGTPPEPESTPSRTSFWEAPPVPIDTRFRVRGPRTARGRVPQVTSRRSARAAARVAAAEERRAMVLAEEALLTRSGTRLSTWSPLGQHESDLFLDLLACVLSSHPDPQSGIRTAVSGDGRWQVVARPATPDAASAVVRTHVGSLVCEDVELEVVLL